MVATPLVGPNDIDYAKCSTETLMNIVKQMGEVLSPETLCVIHQIALNRLQASPESNSKDLLQLLMRTTAARIRS